MVRRRDDDEPVAAAAARECGSAEKRDGRGAGDVVGELAGVSAQLSALCGAHTSRIGGPDDDDSDGDGHGDDAHSAAAIASECLALLESLSVTDEEDASSCHELFSPIERTTETALLREIHELGDELQKLVAALAAPLGDAGAVESAESSYAPVVSAICTSPKMAELAKRLESRPTTRSMVVHTALHRHKQFPLRIKPSPAPAKKVLSPPKSATRVLLSDAAFWKKYQSKSFRQHITRQSQARTIQIEEEEKLSKAAEYRYRRAARTSYPLAKTNEPLAAASPAQKISLPGVKSTNAHRRSYASRFSTAITTIGVHADAMEDRGGADGGHADDGLLCGVYLYGKRRKGMAYLTCSSLEQLKSKIVRRFSLAQPVVNLYREQVSGATSKQNARDRKFLQRVSRFEELHSGDLLCATTDGYEDMAILCAWMKKRQQVIHHSRHGSGPKPASRVPEQCENRHDESRQTTTKPAQHTTRPPPRLSESSLKFIPPPPSAQPKLWDQNGRLMSTPHRLPIDC